MIFGLREWLEHKGVEKKKIHFELFNTQGAQTQTNRAAASGGRPQETGPSAKVTLRLDGTHYEFELPYDGEPILQAALQQGIDLPYACKGGVCCTCRARLQEGKVDMDLNYALEEDELAQGFILTCQAHPRTPRIIVDFDSK
jgi:ring-1,2-phenylacetyl-CoA epoxidase subunit PaaE